MRGELPLKGAGLTKTEQLIQLMIKTAVGHDQPLAHMQSSCWS